MLDLAEAFIESGHKIDLLLCQKKGDFHNLVHPMINVIFLKPSGSWTSRLRILLMNWKIWPSLLFPILVAYKPPKPIRYLGDLANYLHRERPDALLSAKTPTNLVAIWGKQLAKVHTRTVVSERTHLSMTTERSSKWRWRFIAPLVEKVYPQADRIIAVSTGVADDLAQTAKLSRSAITAIYNPTLTTKITERARAPIEHSWLVSPTVPVILGVGRLVPQKDFPTLLKAFAQVLEKLPSRLIILGKGRERAQLEMLASQLHITNEVSFAGFTPNPYAFMAQASVFVLSSAWEGLPNVLIEALVCGCPIVSTNCPSGPKEILSDGVWGSLVPVGDDQALAQAILQTLHHPPDSERLQARAAEFDIKTISKQYLEILLSD